MKFLLLICCLFGAALAVSWRRYEPEQPFRYEWLNHSISYLTHQIDKLTMTATEYSDAGLTYFSQPVKKLVDKMGRLQTEMIQFPVNGSSNATGSENLDLVYQRLFNEYNLLALETRRLFIKNQQERSKQLALSTAAHQSIAYNASLPEASKLISDVKAIISQEETLRKFGESSDVGKSMMTNLSTKYLELERTLGNANTIVTEKTKQFYKSIKTARTVVDVLQNANETIVFTKKADSLENGLNLAASSAYEMFKLVPIESPEAADRMVALAGITIRAGVILETLLELNSRDDYNNVYISS